ncbi:MAG: alpha-ketoglutarate-dependent dioxygenase AlkB [Myxococcales bacterium]|nr:alpha-ketoglutarate-dependent dioxygenase AlkB [Myxococcales bacterium]
MSRVHDGRSPLALPGLCYLPRFLSVAEADELIAFFASLTPLWEQRHSGRDHGRGGQRDRRITRPVYWLGAWQFACLGYYAEPDHREGRCLRAEPFPAVMRSTLERLRPCLQAHGTPNRLPLLPNTCLINYYGSERGAGPPVDQARLRMHRDGEPGPVVMFCVGQPGLLEFVDPAQVDAPELAIWTRHRSAVVFSGPYFKEQLYHRIVQVRRGGSPALDCRVPNFDLRRVSVSFRHVPESLVTDLDGLPSQARNTVRAYVQELARHSDHFARQLALAPGPGGEQPSPQTP